MIRRPPRSTQSRSSAASDVYKRQLAERRGTSHKSTQTGQVTGRASVERFPCDKSRLVELEAFTVGKNPTGGVAGLRDDEVSEVGTGGGDGTVNEVSLLRCGS